MSGSLSSAFCDKGVPIWIALLCPSPLRASGLAAVSLCSVLTSSRVCISSAIVLRRAGAGDCSIWWLIPLSACRYHRKDAGLPLSLGFKTEAPAFCFLKKDLHCGCKEKLSAVLSRGEEERGESGSLDSLDCIVWLHDPCCVAVSSLLAYTPSVFHPFFFFPF